MVFLENPSAIFEVIDTTARRICEINPYVSSLGNFKVSLYIIKTIDVIFSKQLNL
jgi:hypothetical protein